MEINRINIPQLGFMKNCAKHSSLPMLDMPKDTFERSNIAFKGGLEEDPFDGLELFLSIISGSVMHSMMDLYRNLKEEMEMFVYLSAMGEKRTRSAIKEAKLERIETTNNMLFNGLGINIKRINETLKEAGINSFTQLDNFQRQYNANPAVKSAFEGQEVEAVKIYGQLKIKSQLSRFGDLFLYLYNGEEEKENPDYSKINTYGAFLENIGVKDMKSFEDKFSHLKTKFNDFGSIADKADAVEYLYKTYDSKISMLNELLAQLPDNKKYKAENIYQNLCGVVDYLYEENEGQNLGNLSSYFDIAVDGDKLRQSTIKSFSPLFHKFQDPEDTIDFYEILKDCGISVKDLNTLAAKSVIAESDNLTLLVNFDSITSFIQENQGLNREDAKNLYLNFKDAINAVYNDQDEDTEGIENLLKLINRFGIKNSSCLVDFFNKASGSKRKNITPEELRNFVQLFNFSDSKTLFEDAKKQNSTVVGILSAQKQKYDEAKNIIDEFLKEDKTGFFAGKSSDEIFTEYKNIFGGNFANIPAVLQNIISLEIGDSEEYKQKSQVIEQFNGFFQDRESLLAFFSENKIKLDNSTEDNNYINNCLLVLTDISKGGNSEKVQERINYYAKSGFLLKSKNALTNFLKHFPNEQERMAVLNSFADKEVSSVNALEKFAKKYQGANGSTNNIVPFIMSLPEGINFSDSAQILSGLRKSLEGSYIPMVINNDNILNIDLNYFKQHKKLSSQGTNKLLSSLVNVSEDTNFINGLPKAFTQKPFRYSAYRIAQEIVNKMNESDESYQNLLNKLNIDLDSLSANGKKCSDYIYIKAIESALPKDFVNFVNSSDWLKYSEDNNKVPNLALHARLRMIDRFALNGETKIENLNSPQIKSNLSAIIEAIYTTQPINIKGTDQSKRFVINTMVNRQNIETVLSNKGEIITVVPKSY